MVVAFLIATLLGFLAGLGVGGGSLFILWLTLILKFDPLTARIMNLLFFLPTALISTLFRWKHGKLNFKKVFPGMIAGCISAALFSCFSRYVPNSILQKLLGVLFLIAGWKELTYKPQS